MKSCDNDTADKDNKLYKLGTLIDDLNEIFAKKFIPGENLCIDETMISWHGRLSFRQYIPSKRHKYGIKLFKLCLPHGYTHKLKVYVGKEDSNEDESLMVSERVVMELCQSVLNTNRTLYTDNFYTSVTLAQKLLLQKTHLVGTLRRNRKLNPKSVVHNNVEKGSFTFFF